MSAESILEEAARLVNGPRDQSYGGWQEDFGRTVDIFRAWTGIDLSVRDAIRFMICVKLSREQHRPKRDNRVDACGYMAGLDEVSHGR